MNESFTPPTDDEQSHFIECQLPAGWPVRDYTAEQKEQGRMVIEDAGRRWAEAREQRVLDAIRGTTEQPEEKSGRIIQYHQATEDIKAGEWVTIAGDGGVKRCQNQDELKRVYGRAMQVKRLEDVVPAMRRICDVDSAGLVGERPADESVFTPDQPNPETWRQRPPML